MRLIDGDALKKEFPKDTDWEYPVNTNCYVCEIIDSQPTVEPERKKGHWVGIDDEPCETFECDRCGFVLENWIQGVFYSFCPNCGSDNRE